MNWLRNFMLGRYGLDQLSVGMFVLYLLIWLIERLFGLWWLRFFTAAIILLILLRALSRNTDRRRAENELFLRYWSPVVAWWRNREIRRQGRGAALSQKAQARRVKAEERRQYRFFQCAVCGQKLRVPRGKGKLKIRCPKCGNEFIKKT